jgi:hypothetical protein
MAGLGIPKDRAPTLEMNLEHCFFHFFAETRVIDHDINGWRRAKFVICAEKWHVAT